MAANSAAYITTIGSAKTLHADFGSGTWDGGPIGIPFVTVPGTQPKYPATFTYQDESDTGPYAVPLNAPIEGGSASDWRSPRDRDRYRQLHPLRALFGLSPGE